MQNRIKEAIANHLNTHFPEGWLKGAIPQTLATGATHRVSVPVSPGPTVGPEGAAITLRIYVGSRGRVCVSHQLPGSNEWVVGACS